MFIMSHARPGRPAFDLGAPAASPLVPTNFQETKGRTRPAASEPRLLVPMAFAGKASTPFTPPASAKGTRTRFETRDESRKRAMRRILCIASWFVATPPRGRLSHRAFALLLVPLAGLMALLAGPAQAAPAPAAPSAAWQAVATPDVTTGSVFAMRFIANGRYVSTEIAWTGGAYARLRARATTVGPWEKYTLYASGSAWAIRSKANGRFVSAELGWTGNNYGLLRARATSIGPWERYSLLYNSTSRRYALRSMANGRYVAAELGFPQPFTGELRARSTAIGSWEQFTLHVVG
jgi:hypothetical protein